MRRAERTCAHCGYPMETEISVVDLRTSQRAFICPRCRDRLERGSPPVAALFALLTPEETSCPT